MSRIAKAMRNVGTALRRPTLALDYAGWALQNRFRPGGATRRVCGVTLGSFSGFSEFHSVATGVSSVEQDFLNAFPFRDGAILDIGANLGLFALLMRNVLPDRRIVAFEPAPSTFAALSSNVAGNGATNIECHQVAVSDHDGTVSFVIREHARANSSIGTSALNRGATSVEVPCITLDRFAAEARIERIALLKVDVEGFEAAVFAGANRVLSTLRPQLVYFEVCPALACANGFSADDAAAKLEENGYLLHRIRPDGGFEKADRSRIAQVTLENWLGVCPE
jgi:FkbM family methyltransferase